jgi:hypothetical protein
MHPAHGRFGPAKAEGRLGVTRRHRQWIVAAAVATALAGCGSDSPSPASLAAATPALAGPAPAPVPLPSTPDEASLLDAAYRVDIQRVEAVFDVFPTERQVRVWSDTTFRMRAGQTRPIVHFGPARGGTEVALALNGEGLDPRSESDVHLLRFDTSGQDSLEIQRELPAGVSHRLEASHVLSLTDAFGRFFTAVNDIEGRGNEGFFPTLNTPHELAHHRLVFRVHGAEPYVTLGSGHVTASESSDVQQWVLDTEREVASYTVMFFLAPAADVVSVERRVQGVDVRVVASLGGTPPAAAFAQLETWLPELRTALGPFPMPRGVSIVLTEGGGGMEYYGATITSLRALRHEIFHMYYGCSTVALTYRDSWWDEAIDMWYELSTDPAFPVIPPGYRSGIVGARSPVTVGFDRRAYDEGARIIQAVAEELGGRAAMVAFLRHLHQKRFFDPFTTVDLAGEIHAFSGADFRERFQQWLYSDTESAAEREAAHAWLHRVDMTPSPAIQSLYGR